MNDRDRVVELRRVPVGDVNAKLSSSPAISSPSKTRSKRKPKATLTIPESYELVVTCRDEADQRQVYERLAAEGYACRVLTM